MHTRAAVGGVRMASSGSQRRIICFGLFSLDTANRELHKCGNAVRLQRQHFAVLLMLVERAGQVVSRDEIREHIWDANTFVDFERSINFAINQIRTALGDDAEKPRFVETIPRHGYRFLCPVEVSEAPPVQPEANAAQSAGPAGGHASATLVTPVTGGTAAKTDPQSNGTRWKSRKWLLSGLGFALLVILAGIFMNGHYRLRLHRPWLVKAGTLTGRAHAVELTKVRGRVYSPVFSPDGKQIAFLWNGADQNKADVYVQVIGEEQPLRLTHSGARRICCLAWFPDGQTISFVRCDKDVGSVYIVPVGGGAERKLTEITCNEFDTGATAWTMDGKSLLLLDRCVPGGPSGIVVFSLETGQRRCLTAPSSNDTSDSGLSLSPDGGTVALIQSSLTLFADEIYIIPLEGGTPRRLTADGNLITGMMWAADGRRIIFLSFGGGDRHSDRLWHVSIEGGEVEPETVYPHLGAPSRDGQRLAYVVIGNGEPEAIWRADLAGPGGHVLARKKIVASPEYNAQPQLSPDETKIVFSSQRSGNSEIWRSEADGSNPIQLTSFGGEYGGTPRWSPDGRWIVFDRYPAKHPQIYVIDAEGRNMRAMTDGDGDNCVPSWSRDGESIYFGSARSGSWQIWKQSVHGGGAVQITQHGGFTGFESYDGKTFYYSKDVEGLWSVPVDGGAEALVTPGLRQGYWGAWAVSETGIYLIDDDVLPRPTIEFYNFRTRRLNAVMQIEYSPLEEGDPSLDASRDGRIVLFAQHRPQSSIAMVENFQ
jgi:Tol biopolymer transport system component/DNA-binding winged helix-turn-helix (wHTH) protein